jgi:hypothetical protein
MNSITVEFLDILQSGLASVGSKKMQGHLKQKAVKVLCV